MQHSADQASLLDFTNITFCGIFCFMYAHKGSDRVAFVGEKYTVKLARSHPIQLGISLHSTIEDRGIKYAVDFWRDHDADQLGSFRRMVFHGLVANRREHRIAKHFTRIVIPTVSVLGGIANVQPTSKAPDIDFRDIWDSFYDHLGPKTTKLGHMMEDIRNFGIYENCVMFVDGGSHGLEELLHTRSGDIEKSLGSVSVKLGLTES